MAPQPSPQGAATLKQLTFRISSTPVHQLPRVAVQLSGSLWACRDILSSTAPSTKSNSEDGVTVHRFKTQLTTLLQDRTIEGKWSAVVLLKATIEAGGLEVLSKSSGWVKSLLGFLKKPDPPTTRSLTVITLVRIFMLTWDHANLVREITTPSLPTFVSTCLSNAENKRCSASELQTYLEALITLLPRHPTTFRSAEKNIRDVLNRIISSTARSDGPQHYFDSHVKAAQKLLVLLHNCAPKQGAPAKWDESLKATVTATHATCDRVFRSVMEDWRSNSGVHASAPMQQLLVGDLEVESPDAIGLSSWKGVYDGSERMVALLGLVQAHIESATASSATIRIGMIADLTTRLLSVNIPTPGRQDFVKPNHQISRDERDAMYSVLPRIHIATLQLIDSILARFGAALLSIVPSLTEQLTSIFKAERADELLKAKAYGTFGQILKIAGHTFSKDEITDITPLITTCCFDMLPEDDRARLPTSSNSIQQLIAQAASQNAKPLDISATQPSALQEAAFALMPLLLSKLDPKLVSRKLRASIDRTAILTKHKDALVQSVLNPPVNPSGTGAQASLLPFLATLYPGDAEVEAIIRPRMPVTWTGHRKGAQEDEGDEDEEDIDMEDADDQADEDAIPQTDLLSALDEHLGNNTSSEQIISDTTPRAPSPTAPTETTTSKRAAQSAPEPAVPAKRLRASPVAESVADATPQDLPGADPVTARAPVPTTVVTRSSRPQETVTLPPKASKAAPKDDDHDDGSDFEMPPLTMESSGDEDDGEDDEEGNE